MTSRRYISASAAANLLAFGVERTFDSYAVEIPDIDSAIFTRHVRIWEYLGDDRTQKLLKAVSILKDAASRRDNSGRSEVQAWAHKSTTKSTVESQWAEEAPGRINVRLIEGPPPKHGAVDPSYFIGENFAIDITREALVFTARAISAPNGSLEIIDTKFAGLLFDRDQVEKLRGSERNPLRGESETAEVETAEVETFNRKNDAAVISAIRELRSRPESKGDAYGLGAIFADRELHAGSPETRVRLVDKHRNGFVRLMKNHQPRWQRMQKAADEIR